MRLLYAKRQNSYGTNYVICAADAATQCSSPPRAIQTVDTFADSCKILTDSLGVSVSDTNAFQAGFVEVVKSAIALFADQNGGVNLAGSGSGSGEEEEKTDVLDLVAPFGSSVSGPIVITSNSGAVVTSSQEWSFIEPGQITAVVPSSGQHGALVTIVGTNLRGGGTEVLSVSLGQFDAKIEGESNERITVTIPPAPASGGVEITLVTSSGAIIREISGLWQFSEPGVIGTISPSSGQLKSIVTIEGTDLRSGGERIVSVTLNEVEVQKISFESDTVITVVAARGDVGHGDIVVTSNTNSFIVGVGKWDYHAEGVIGSITPDSGVLGTQVTIRGVHLYGGASAIDTVSLANILVESIDKSSNTEIIVTAANRTAIPGGTCTFCHSTCATCSGPGSDECTSCPELLTLSTSGSCSSVCVDGLYRDVAGVVEATVEASMDGVVAQFYTSALQEDFARLLSARLVLNAPVQGSGNSVDGSGGSADPIASVAVTNVVANSAGNGAVLTIKIGADQSLYEEIAELTRTTLVESSFVQDLKDTGKYPYTQKVASGDVAVSTGTMCQQCDDSCDTCIEGSDESCALCSKDRVRLDRSCLKECPETMFYDTTDERCKTHRMRKG